MTTEQDRRSRMAYTTYKAPAKKDGAGGAFTWGSTLDSATFYDSRVTATPGVTLAPAPVFQPSIAVAQTLPVINNQVSFPTLGSAPTPRVKSSWGPTVANAVPTAAPMPAKVVREISARAQGAGSVNVPVEDFMKSLKPAAYQSRRIEQDRHSRMAYTTYKEPAKKDGAGGTFTWGSPLDSATFYDSHVTATPSVTLAPAPILQTTIAVAQILPDIQDPVAFPILQEQTLDTNVALEAVTAQNLAEDLAVIEIAQGMDETQNVVILADTAAFITTQVEECIIVNETCVTQDAALVEVARVEVVVPQEVVPTGSPSEISAEEEASEDTSSRLPLETKGTNTLTCLQGCFEWMSPKKL